MRFLFVDRIVELSPGGITKGIKQITSDDFYLTRDNKEQPCFIPTLVGETLGQLTAWNVMHCNQFKFRPVAGIVAAAHLHRPVYIGETLLLESFIDVLDDGAVQYHGFARVNQETVFTLEGALGPLLPMENFIAQQQVTQQFNEINRPGDWTNFTAQPVRQPLLSSTPALSTNRVNLYFDRILACTPGVSISAEKLITRAAAYFDDHFPNKPVLPMTILLQCILNLSDSFLQQTGLDQHYQVSRMEKIKMNEFVQPGDILLCHGKVKRQSDEELVLSFRNEIDAKRVCVLDVVLTARNSL